MAIWSISKEWLLDRIERVADPLLQVNDEWEYRRHLEFYVQLDSGLTERLIE